MSTTEQSDSKKHTAVRIPSDLAQRLGEVRENEGRTQTWVIEQALRAYFKQERAG